MPTIPTVNMRVKTYTTKGIYLGLGTITKVGPLYIEYDDGTTERASEYYPAEIKLDNGDIREGLDCWWMPVKEE